MPENNKGALATLLAFFMWGIFPIYWKFLSTVPAMEILAYRIFFSGLSMLALVFILKKSKEALAAWQTVKNSRQKLFCVTAGAALISVNWFTFIWAVNAGRILDSSLGYYINPLVSVGIGVLFLGEKLSRPHRIAVMLATAGVGYMTIQFGDLPWVALSLALSYAFYGLCKKLAGLDAISGMLIETLITAPFAASYLFFLYNSGAATPLSGATFAFLSTTGIVTVIPLILFAYGANRLPLSIIGLCQYITPTMSLLIGVFLYHEPFSYVQLISFALIWCGLAIFSLPQIIALREKWRLEKKT